MSRRRANSGADSTESLRLNSPSMRRPRSRPGTMYLSVAPIFSTSLMSLFFPACLFRQCLRYASGHGLGLLNIAGVPRAGDERKGEAMPLRVCEGLLRRGDHV